MCNSETEQECLQRNLFGAPLNKACEISNLPKGCALFLLNFSQPKTLLGVFMANGIAKHNIVPQAWEGKFQCQVRMTPYLL